MVYVMSKTIIYSKSRLESDSSRAKLTWISKKSANKAEKQIKALKESSVILKNSNANKHK